MNRGRPSAAAWLLPAAALAVWLPAWVLALHPPAGQEQVPTLYLLYGVPYLAFAAVGGLIIRGQRAARVGWVMAGIGLFQGVGTLGGEVAVRVAESAAGGWLEVATAPVDVAATGLIVVLLLVFPDGRLPSPRWRWFLRAIVVLLAVVVVFQVTSPEPPPDLPGLPVSPLAAPRIAAALAPVTPFWLFPVALLLAAASLVVRFRAGGVVVRQQIKWLALSAVALALREAGNAALGTQGALSGVRDAAGKLAVVAAVGIAVLRHRLYDVDLAISRALAYGWLAAVVTAVYVVLVVGVGSRVGSAGRPDLGLSVAATVVVALISLPLRDRLQELANRLVYGRRQAPYDSLAGFTRQLADRSRMGDVVPAIAAARGQGLRARAGAVRLSGESTETWPPGTAPPHIAPSGGADVTYRGRLLGSLSVWTDAGLTDAEQRLLTDLASQAGLVLHNAHLGEQLEQRLLELRASRLRLVAAQDGERRRFERDLHDGAQQDLVTLRMKLGQAERAAAIGDPDLGPLLAELRQHTAATLESIRRLSRGLYPPLLQSQGLVPALTAHARRMPLPVEVHGPESRFSPEVETAVYFCCIEALQNVVKHADATRCRVALSGEDGDLRFEVCDDGCGFPADGARAGSGLQNMADRLEALGGRLGVHSDAAGTRIRGRVPGEPVGRTAAAPTPPGPP